MTYKTRQSRAFAAGLLLALLAGSPASHADDTELLLVNAPYDPNAFRSNILLIIDSSGSMSTQEATSEPYNGALTYSGACDNSRLYWTDVDVVPTCAVSASSGGLLTENSRAINKTAFQCLQAERQLGGTGSYTNMLVQYRANDDGRTRWLTLQAGNLDGPVECREDSGIHGEYGGQSNAVYAAAGTSGQQYTPNPGKEIAWGSFPTSEVYTVYDGNYLNWLENPVQTSKSRISIVKDSVKKVLNSINNAQVGIMRFNNTEGGVVIKGLTELASNREALNSSIDSINANGFTPLGETLYEAALYWQGLPAYYGERITQHTTDPNALASASPKVYQSPDMPVCTRNYNILLTDGEPTEDLGAQALAPTLPGWASRLGRTSCSGTGQGGCLADIAEYLSVPDLVSAQDGDQYVTTHTVGFTINLPLLQKAAEASSGNYYLADDEESLTRALLQIFTDANERALSFSAPAIAVNSFNRTQHLDDLYMTVFQAQPKVHWPGNVKKYTIKDRQIVDANGIPAIDEQTGFFTESAKSFWTVGAADGTDVTLGGAAQNLPDPATRRLFTNNGNDNSLTGASNAITPSNANAYIPADFGLTGAEGEPSIDEIIRWARGEDVRDEDLDSTTLVRNVIGDPLHSQPAAVVYGGQGSSADVVLYAATNDGYLHAIDGASGEELWSFIPKELLPDLGKLFFNDDASSKHYGIDGDIVPIVADRDNNGTIDGDDFVYIVFGMRRGGNSYYAIDVTRRNDPQLLWQVNYPGMGQSWSAPSIARVDVNGAQQNDDKAVVILGGGYDTVHDVAAHPDQPDAEGAGIHMLDLVSGEELWRAGADTGADLRLNRMTRAIPSRIRVIDMNGDKLADRMYAADLGGQVWRIDLFNGRFANQLATGGVIGQFGAEGTAVASPTETRRFYNSPDVALFTDTTQNRRYLSVSIGSGYRAHPLDSDAADRFYSLRDPDIFNALTQAEYDGYDIARDADMVEVSGRLNVALTPEDRGWKLTLPPTQKVLTDSVTFDNSVFFTGFSPDIRAAADCRASVGRNFLYRMNIVNGDPVVNNRDLLTAETADAARSTDLAQGGIAPSPTFLFPSSGDENCEGESCLQPPLGCVGVECFDPGFVNRPVRTLWTQDGIQ